MSRACAPTRTSWRPPCPYGLSPLVVPQLKTITLGGAVTGLGIESTSFRNGLPHESVLEMDILTGTGDVLTASPDQHSDLYRAFPNSYGTLGYSVRLKIELEPVKPFVALNHLRFHSLQDLVAAMDRIIETGGHDGVPVDYLDGVVFSSDESYLSLGIADRHARARSATTPASRSTTAPSSIRTARSTTGSPSMTTCGDGTPTGSGAHGRSARSTRGSAGCGRGAIGAAASTGSSSATTSGSTSPTASRSATAARPCERVVQDIEVPIETDRRVPGLVPGHCAHRADLGVPAAPAGRRATGRCTRSARTTPTSTSGSGRRYRSDPPKATPTG